MIRTTHLLLRGWRHDDAVAHHGLCNDPRIALMLGGAPLPADSIEVVHRQQALQEQYGYCFWAMEKDDAFIGWCGIKPGKPPIAGETEIGWTIAPALWGDSLAYEAATAVLEWTWRNTKLTCLAAITAAKNTRSRALMRRLGMEYEPCGDFDHPELAAEDPLRLHVLYRIRRS